MRLCVLVRVCPIALSLVHCGGGSDSDEPPVLELSLVSFNAALGVGLAPHLEQRLDAIEADLPGLDADVVCLQEVWLPENVDRLVASLSDEYPYSHRSVRDTGGGGAACSQQEATSLATCLNDNCGEVDRDGLPLCAIANCAGPFTEVSMPCQQCIASNQSAMDVENLTTICASAEAGAAAYADQTGLLLLSRLPLERPSYAAFESSLGDRGLLSARLHTDFLGEVDLHCTHLAASLAEVPYTGPYGSWQGERLRQIDQMLDRVAQVSADGNAAGNAILLGDMNCGPGTASARATSPDAFERLTAAGFVAPFADLDGRCTFCENNPLNGAVTAPEEGALIDHVLVPVSASDAFSGRRVLDNVFPIDVDGTVIDTAHSDHYGVQVQTASAESVGSARP